VQIEPTDVQVHPGQTARLPTGSGMQIESLDPQSRPIQTACTPPSLATQQLEEDGLTALQSLQLKPIYTPDDDSARPTGHAVAQQQEGEMAVERELAALQLKDSDDRSLVALAEQVHDFRHKPETEMRDDSSYREEPLTKQEMEIKGEESLPSDEDDQPHDHVPERRCQKGETEIDAKAGTTRHLSRYPDGMSA